VVPLGPVTAGPLGGTLLEYAGRDAFITINQVLRNWSPVKWLLGIQMEEPCCIDVVIQAALVTMACEAVGIDAFEPLRDQGF
jgi:hypothetical protein